MITSSLSRETCCLDADAPPAPKCSVPGKMGFRGVKPKHFARFWFTSERRYVKAVPVRSQFVRTRMLHGQVAVIKCVCRRIKWRRCSFPSVAALPRQHLSAFLGFIQVGSEVRGGQDDLPGSHSERPASRFSSGHREPDPLYRFKLHPWLGFAFRRRSS